MDLQDLITGRIQQVEIPDSLINKLLNDHGLHHTIQISNSYMVLSADNFKAELSYHSHNFSNGNVTINFILNRIKPFYYSMGLRLIHKRYPHLEYRKDLDGNKMITCHLDRIPEIDSIFKDYVPCIKHIDIKSISCGEGKIIVGLRTKSGGTEGDDQHV